MPINPNALSSPGPSSDTEVAQTVAASDDAVQTAAVSVDPTDAHSQDATAKPKRRTKVEMIRDAVIPGDAEMVEVRDVNTGAKVQRAWPEAKQLVASGAVEFSDKTLKYAVLKQEQQAAAPAFVQPATDGGEVDAVAPDGTELAQSGGAAASTSVPPDAALGDEVRVGSDTLRVGHGGVLTSSVVAVDGVQVKPKRRWQRELGTGTNGPWQSVALTQTSDPKPILDIKPDSGKEDIVSQAVRTGQPVVETQKLPHTQELLPDGIVKIGTGVLEKIGLPDYSQFQIGPISISRSIQDDGRRSEVTFADGRTAEVITSALEGFELMDNTVEYVAARFRGQLISFLQSTGALKQASS